MIPSPPVFFALFVIFAAGASADTVELTNGRTMDGLIAADTTNGITLNIGVGEVIFKRSQIRAVHRSTAAQADAVRAGWQEKYYSHRNFVPERFTSLAAKIETLAGQRNAAADAHKNIAQRKADNDRLLEKIKQDQAEFVRTHARIGQSPPPASFRTLEELNTYNGLIARGNTLQSALVLAQQTLADNQNRTESDTASVGDYIRDLNEFMPVLDAQTAQHTNETVFLAQAQRQVAAYQRELQRIEWPYEERGDHTVLDVKINGKAAGKFLVDTGASLVVLSRAGAQLLGLDIETNETVRVTMANGETSSAHPVLLRSVEAGGAEASHVPAVVMDKGPGAGLDGLLGMSFLREFVLRFDARTRRVELIRFEPAP